MTERDLEVKTDVPGSALEHGDIVMEFHHDVRKVATKKERPTVEDLSRIFALAKRLPSLDIDLLYGIAKARNTDLYREIAEDARHLLGSEETPPASKECAA